MRCIRPLKASFDFEGNLTYSMMQFDKSQVGFEFPCRKCLPCRLNIGKEKAIRCVHEAKMHEHNIFLTLTYDEDHLISDRLIYSDFQNFMKSLRERVNRGVEDPDERRKRYIPYMVTGEYGEINKRPHWHAILFNYRPSDSKFKYSTELGERVFDSEFISSLWKRGNIEFGSVTYDSAGYVARYAAKKLVHGKDEEHDYHPIHRISQRRAIGRSWIEKYYKHTFENGFVVLPNGQTDKIPRYYIDWCKEHQPKVYEYYVSEVQPIINKKSELTARKEEMEFLSQLKNWKPSKKYPFSRAKVKERVLQSKFKMLQERLKL